jgi:hypothetical protein
VTKKRRTKEGDLRCKLGARGKLQERGECAIPG